MPASLYSRFPEIVADLPRKVAEGVKEAATVIADDAKSRVPVDSGDLRAAIHIDNRGPASYAVVAGDGDKKGIYYGHFVEFGTVKASPHPFLVPALEENVDTALELVTDKLKDL